MHVDLLSEIRTVIYTELERLETEKSTVLFLTDVELGLDAQLLGKNFVVRGPDAIDAVKDKFDIIITVLLDQTDFDQEKHIDTCLRSDGFVMVIQPIGGHILKKLPYIKLKSSLIKADGEYYSVEVVKKHTTAKRLVPTYKAKVTVIIPCYNYGRFLPESIDSVLNQTRMPDQIILSDDASTDNSVSIMESYQRQYPDIIELNLRKENRGIEAHFNQVIEKAEGDFICFLGADNRMPPHYVESLAAILENNKEVAVAYTDFAFFGNRSKMIFDKFKKEFKDVYLGYDVYTTDFPNYNEESRRLIDQGVNFIHGSSIFRKKAFDDVGGYGSREEGAEDKVLFRKILHQGWLAEKAEGVYLEYRQHSNEQANLQFSYFSELKFLREENQKQRKRIARLDGDIDRKDTELHELGQKVEQMSQRIANLEMSAQQQLKILAKRSLRKSRVVLGRVKRKAASKIKQITSRRDTSGDQALFRNYILPIYHPSDFSVSRINATLIVHRTGRPTSSAFIRLISPLTHPSVSEDIGLEVTDPGEFLIRKGTNVCIVQRTAIPTVREARKMAAELKRRDIKLVIDNDDAFTHLTVAHPEHVQQGEKIKAMDFLMKEADEIWVSTNRLQRDYADQRHVVVVENTLDERVWTSLKTEVYRPLRDTEPLQLVYMGTVTHGADFALVKPVFEKLYKKYPGEFMLTVIGIEDGLSQSPWITVQAPYHPIYPEFAKWFSSLGPFDIGISPLEDTPFNGGKSDIKCLDYLANGIRPIVSDVEAYRNKDLDELIVRVANKEADWFKVLENEIKNKKKNREQREKYTLAGYRYIKQERSAQVSAQLLLDRLRHINDK